MPVAADLQPLLDAMVEARNTPISEASPEDRRALFDEMFGPGVRRWDRLPTVSSSVGTGTTSLFGSTARLEWRLSLIHI